jgi:hypothetical protein
MFDSYREMIRKFLPDSSFQDQPHRIGPLQYSSSTRLLLQKGYFR